MVRTAAGMVLTSLLIMVSFALARSPSLHTFFGVFGSLNGDWSNLGEGLGPFIGIIRRLLVALVIIYFAPNAYELLSRYRPGITTWVVRSTTPAISRIRWRPTLMWAVFVAALGFAVFSRLAAPVPFVYGIY